MILSLSLPSIAIHWLHRRKSVHSLWPSSVLLSTSVFPLDTIRRRLRSGDSRTRLAAGVRILLVLLFRLLRCHGFPRPVLNKALLPLVLCALVHLIGPAPFSRQLWSPFTARGCHSFRLLLSHLLLDSVGVLVPCCSICDVFEWSCTHSTIRFRRTRLEGVK